MIDNFDIIRSHLTFESDFDRYIVHIIKRAKDDRGVEYGSNETNRLIKTFYITSLEYFDRKIPVIKDLCESNGARAYILPQVRNNEDCMKELLKIVVDNLGNPTLKPDRLIRSAYCGYHGSRDKKWIIDLDSDNMVEYISKDKKKTWKPEKVLEFVQKQLVNIGKSENDAWMIPTKNGHCIVTSPFDLQKAYKKCSMMFQGQQKMEVGTEYFGIEEHPKMKAVTGWMIKDGMALLYVNQGEEKK